MPGLLDDRFREWEGGQEPVVGRPGHTALLAAFAERLAPEPDDTVLEHAERAVVEDDAIVLVVTSQYPP